MTTTQDLKSKLKPSKTHSFPLQVQVQELPRKGKKRRRITRSFDQDIIFLSLQSKFQEFSEIEKNN